VFITAYIGGGVLMNIFGINITRNSSKEKTTDVQINPHKDLGVEYRDLLHEYNVAHVQYFQNITFPSMDDLDAFQQLKFKSIVAGIMKNVAKGGNFSICDVTDLMDLCKLRYTEETWKYYQNLHSLHCLNFRNIPSDILREVPRMMTAIFTEGLTIRDVTEGAPPERLMTNLEWRIWEKRDE
jgi:hypothetical protein